MCPHTLYRKAPAWFWPCALSFYSLAALGVGAFLHFIG